LVDCDPKNHGCGGGSILRAIQFATTTRNGAIPSEGDYPYKAIKQACNLEIVAAAGFDDYRFVYPGDEQQLVQAVAQQPVASSIYIGVDFLQFQGGEIYSGPCGKEPHAVAIVGYGISHDGVKYWILKNSHGENWGDSGFMKLIRGTGSPNGHCDILLNFSVYPILMDPTT
jgi:C1A family cysteine protease